MDKVRDVQDCLQRELVALDLSRTLTEISEHQEKVEELKNQLDEMLLLLKVHMCSGIVELSLVSY